MDSAEDDQSAWSLLNLAWSLGPRERKALEQLATHPANPPKGVGPKLLFDLAQKGLIERTGSMTRPLYKLTNQGRAVLPVLNFLGRKTKN